MTAATLQDRVREYFTLNDAQRIVATIPEEARASTYRDLHVAFQKREAAETLWPRGSTAEALKLAVAALDTVNAALATFPVEPHPTWLERARTLGTDAKKKLGDQPLPTLEKETLPAHEETFRVLLDALIAIEECAGVSLAAPNDLKRIRNLRMTTAVAGGVVLLGALVVWFHAPMFSKATASSQRDEAGAPDKAYDGNISTGWFLPDHVSQGWIDLTLGKARPIKTIHILPGNPPYNDRDVKDARFDAMLGDAVVKSLDMSFPEPQGSDPGWVDVNLDAPTSDHLRITVKSNYKAGAGITEIELK
jgi:hypothetical protein